MAYTPTDWKNREVERPRTFRKEEHPDGTFTLIPAEGNVIETGTPIIADVMNNIERGIVDAHDLAAQAFQSASEGKEVVATAITGKGIQASGSDTFPTLAEKINQIETDKTGDATAAEADLLTGKTAYARGQKLNGKMPNRGSVGTQQLTVQNQIYTIPAGYHNGQGNVQATYAAGKRFINRTNLAPATLITGIGFTPRVIIAWATGGKGQGMAFYESYSGYAISNFEKSGSNVYQDGSAFVNVSNGQFRCNASFGGFNYDCIVFE